MYKFFTHVGFDINFLPSDNLLPILHRSEVLVPILKTSENLVHTLHVCEN